MTRLLLIRHGQSTWNSEGLWQGQEDPPLTDTGRRQAAEASPAIGSVDAVFSSTLERARVTAEIIAESIGVGPVIQLPGLIERCAGEWQGMTRSQIEVEYPGFLEAGLRPPSWEPDEHLLARVTESLDAIVAALGDDGEAVVVTHGGVIYQVESWLGAAFERLANLGSRWVECVGGTWRLGDRIDLLGGIDVTIPDQI